MSVDLRVILRYRVTHYRPVNPVAILKLFVDPQLRLTETTNGTDRESQTKVSVNAGYRA